MYIRKVGSLGSPSSSLPSNILSFLKGSWVRKKKPKNRRRKSVAGTNDDGITRVIYDGFIWSVQETDGRNSDRLRQIFHGTQPISMDWSSQYELRDSSMITKDFPITHGMSHHQSAERSPVLGNVIRGDFSYKTVGSLGYTVLVFHRILLFF